MEIKSGNHSFNLDVNKTPILFLQNTSRSTSKSDSSTPAGAYFKHTTNSSPIDTPLKTVCSPSVQQIQSSTQHRNIFRASKMAGSPNPTEEYLDTPNLSPIWFPSSPESRIFHQLQQMKFLDSSQASEFSMDGSIGSINDYLGEEKITENESCGDSSHELSGVSRKECSMLDYTISVACVLEKLNLQMYESYFEGIDFYDFLHFDDDGLRMMGIENGKHREKILEYTKSFSM